MTEFRNRNLERTEPIYYYSVWEFVTTFGADPGKNEPIDHLEIFEGHNLWECKMKAEKYYWERSRGLENGKYFLPFAAFEDFEEGKHAAYSLVLSLVEYYSDDEFYEYPLLGYDRDTMEESTETENYVLKEMGFSDRRF